jgi:hypothetical protein
MAEWDWGIKSMLVTFNDHLAFLSLLSADRIAPTVD